ncbi:permease prefix domain 1-containing protein [Streptosporangium roseum]|uniref:permease prefix domain 1-containing protein n=1 Tax=Streptosporangium roseum TaxID=2001 RepID=UPI0033275134
MTAGAATAGKVEAETSVIDDFVDRLCRMLKGPSHAKRDLLAEARDGLVDAAEALERRGFGRVEAERRAVREFGLLGEIAHGYQRELSAQAMEFTCD